MLRVAATIRNDKHLPFSILGTGTGHVSPKVKTSHSGPVRDVATCELNLSKHQLVVGCACFLGVAKLLLWALLKLWLFEP
jgi:hypothetical protein